MAAAIQWFPPHPVGSTISRPGTSTPKGRFVLRADSIRPYRGCGIFAAAEPPTGGFYPPLRFGWGSCCHSTNGSVPSGFGRILSVPWGCGIFAAASGLKKMPPAHRRSEPMRWGTECFIWGHYRLYLPFFLPLLAVFTSSAPVASMARIITTISTPKMLFPSVA